MQPSPRRKRLLSRGVAPIVAALIVSFVLTYEGTGWFGQRMRWVNPASQAPPFAPAPIRSQKRVTDYLRASPVFIGEQLYGYALYAGRRSEPFSELGLQPGDVLRRINGTAIVTPAVAVAALRALVEGAALTVVIERQGVAQTRLLDGAIFARAIAGEQNAATVPAGTLTPL